MNYQLRITNYQLLITFILSILLLNFAFAQNVEFTKDNFKDNKDGFKEAKNAIETGDKLFSQGSIFYKQALEPYLAANNLIRIMLC